MVKRPLIIFTLLFLGAAQLSLLAQGGNVSPDYQMILSDRISFFEGDYEQINCIRIDSAHFNLNLVLSGSDTLSMDFDSVFFPMDNIQYESDLCATPYGASWIGKKVVVQRDGDHLFFNKYADTIRIKTSAKAGESWKAYTSENWLVMATVQEHGPLNFLGLTDSVKTITFQVYDLKMNPLTHDLNKQTVQCSKKYGAVQMLNFYQFPDIFQLSYGYWGRRLTTFQLAGLSAPQVGVHNLSWFEVFDFQPGDEIHTLLDKFSWYSEGNGSSLYERTIKHFLNRTDYPDSIVYEYERKVSRHFVKNTSPTISFSHDTALMVIRSNPDFDRLPGEVIVDGDWAYSQSMLAGDWISKRIPSIAERIERTADDSCWSICCYDGCFMSESYYGGLGGPYGSCTEAFVFGKTEYKLVYFKKEAETWGSPYELTGVEQVEAPSPIRVYPNPASDYAWIESSSQPIEEIYLMDLSGRVVLEQAAFSNAVKLDLAALSAGIYFLKTRVNGEEYTTRIIKTP